MQGLLVNKVNLSYLTMHVINSGLNYYCQI